MSDSRDRPDPKAVEVTPEMIDAGSRLLAELAGAAPYLSRSLAREVYQVMHALSPEFCQRSAKRAS